MTIKKLLPYLLLLPALSTMLFAHLVPSSAGVIMSFFRVDRFYISKLFQAPWIGLGNYYEALTPLGIGSRPFLDSIRVTLLFTVGSHILCFGLGLGAALLLNEKFRGRNVLRGLMLFPYVIPRVVSIINWRFTFEREWGIINKLLLTAGFKPIIWLTGKNIIYSIIMIDAWIGWPFWFIMLLAGLQTIPRELYEAAAIDGASVLQKFRRTTLPSLWPVISILVLLSTLFNFNKFRIPYVMFGKTPPPNGDLLTVRIYNIAFQQWNFGFSGAMSVILLLITIAFLWAYTKILKVGKGQFAGGVM